MSRTRTSGTDYPVLALPKPDATEGELSAHFKQVGLVLASAPYDDAIHLCLTCCRIGENVTGKKNSPSGRNRFCSDACEAAYDRRWTLYAARRGGKAVS